jgi:hypothetical protein
MSGRVAWLKRNDFSYYFAPSFTRFAAMTEITVFPETSAHCYYTKCVTLSDIATRIAINLRT